MLILNYFGVLVEYSDPFDLYPSVARELNERLPLKGLHWNNSSGFTRSIHNLFVELVPEDSSKPTPDATSHDGSSDIQTTRSVSRIEGLRKERRHQFPGLRRTPYLKIYLLQCGDIDAYKATQRKQLRDWVKNHSPSAQSSSQLNKQEHHDAFEWLIVHVLSSPTDGLSTYRNDGNAERRSNTSRWPSRSSSNVIEKIRADFNGTSKNAVDRVAQVQLTEHSAEDSVQIKRQSQDLQNGWADLTSKLKSLILASFDLRVSQYEEDIKEKEMQRNLPGWNFNTFFVLKEGLALGFENLGLLEDALTVYRELAVGLGSVIEGQEGNLDDNQQTSQFSPYTDELKTVAEQAATVKSGSNQQGDEEIDFALDLGASILDTDRKPFRNLILESNISLFDFQSYVFARQMSLLLNLANAVIHKPNTFADKASNGTDADPAISARLSNLAQDSSVNLLVLAEAIELSSEFIASIAQTVRKDFDYALMPSNADHKTDRIILDAIKDNLTGSWTFSACQCILNATSAPSLLKQLDQLSRQFNQNPMNESSHEQGQGTDVTHRNVLPARTSSLPSPTKVQSLLTRSIPSIDLSDAMWSSPLGSKHPGTAQLAAQRGDLLALQRRVLGNIGLRLRGWQGTLADIATEFAMHQDSMEDVKLDNELADEEGAFEGSGDIPNLSTTAGIRNSSILFALKSRSSFFTAYKV